MQNPNKEHRLSGNALLYFSAKFFPALATLLSWMYLSRHLPAAEYGQYQGFWIQLITFTAILGLGFPAFILTYNAEKAAALLQKLGAERVLSYSGLAVLGGILFAGIQFVTSGIPAIYAFVFLLLNLVVLFTEAILTVFRSFRPLILVNVLFAVLFYGVHRYAVDRQYTLDRLVLMLLTLFAIRALFTCALSRRSYLRQERKPLVAADWPEMRQLWIQMGIGDTIQVLFRWIDKFILSFILAKEVFAVYVNATIEIPFLPIVFASVSSAALQQWAVHHGRNNTNPITVLHFSARILSSIIFPLFLYLMLFGREFLTTVFSAQYAEGLTIFLCAQLVLPLRTYPFTALLQNHHRGDIINKGALIDFAMACVLMYPLYMLIGLPGVALSFVLSTYWQAAYYLRQSARVTGIPMMQLVPVRTLLLKLLLFAGIFVAGRLLMNAASWSAHGIFYVATGLLIMIASCSLLLEWHREKKYEHGYTSQ